MVLEEILQINPHHQSEPRAQKPTQSSKQNLPLELPEYIDRPEYVRNKAAGYSLLAIGWLCWMGLFMPLLTLLFWWYQGNVIYSQAFQQIRPMTGQSVMQLSFWIAALISILLLWASYNWIRFSQVDQRQTQKMLSDEKIAQSFQLGVTDIERMKAAKHLTLYYSEQGILQDYEVKALQTTSSASQHRDEP